MKFADEGNGQFEGYLSIFDSVDSYGDTVIKGAYKETLKGRTSPLPMLLNHNMRGIPVGKWLDVKEDNTGLRVKGELTPGNPESEQVYAALKHGAMSGLSIGYRAEKFEENDHGGLNLLRVKLHEGSIVSIPAEDQARIDVVKLDEFGDIETKRDLERALRDANFSKAAAKSLMSRIDEIYRREDGDAQEQIKALHSELERVKSQKARDALLSRSDELLRSMKQNRK
jgi:HK97 family phage prohead protease